MPDGFYRRLGGSLDGIDQVKRVVLDGDQVLELGFTYRFGMGTLSSSPLRGTLDGCLFTGHERYDLLGIDYHGVWSCEDQRLAGTADRTDAGGGSLEDLSFAFEPTTTPWYIGVGGYRLYGSETHAIAPIGSDYPGYHPADLAHPEEADWELIGEAVDSTTFELSKPYPALMLTWPESPTFGFDALTDEVSGQSLSAAFDSPDVGFAAHTNDRPEDLAGPPDGELFAGVTDRAGFVEVTFPDKNSAPVVDGNTGTARIHVELGAN
jgi:hypothetical protein